MNCKEIYIVLTFNSQRHFALLNAVQSILYLQQFTSLVKCCQ